MRRGALVLALLGAPAAAQEPLSAIDWLSQSVDSAAAAAPQPSLPDEPPVAGSAATPEITVRPLDAPSPDRVGLLPPAITGLPATLWSASEEATLTSLIRAERVETLPAIQELIVTLMLAEAEPPQGAEAAGALFLARVDKLLDLGALDPAQAMLEAADNGNPEVFRRRLDVALLTGTEDSACSEMMRRPAIAPTYPARIFCLARNGDWAAAALTLNTARALGEVSEEEESLLARFLDPELFDGMPPLPPPSRPSPLVFRLREAVGEPLPTGTLPRAFAHADLRPTSAWRTRLEAAERLARTGAISGSVLFAFYAERPPAASGGIWDRVAAIQEFDSAIRARDGAAVAAALPAAWSAMVEARTEVAFAREYAEALRALDLPGDAGRLAFRIGLLAPSYEATVLAGLPPGDAEALLWAGIARGEVAGLEAPDARTAAVLAAFRPAALSEPFESLLAAGKLGEAILRAVATFNAGLSGDPAAVTEGLALLRRVGLEDAARRAALQYLLLDRPT
jgi:hypothetical protein